MENLPVHIVHFLGLPYEQKEVRDPAIRVYKSCEDEKWFFGMPQIIEELTRMRLLSPQSLQRDTWAMAGVEFVQKEVKPVLDFIFRSPLVVSQARRRTQYGNPAI